jgi:hypothetical protein
MSSSNSARLLTIAAGLIVAFAILCPGVQAKRPNPGYQQFAGCPSPAERSESVTCLHAAIVGGHLKLGNKETPIENPIGLTGGVQSFSMPSPLLFNSEGGGMSKAKQKLAGSIASLTGALSLTKSLGKEAQVVYATTELAGTPIFTFPDVMKIPIKVHLENSALGSKCYIGSDASPIVLNLMTGTTNPPVPIQPISGKTFIPAFEPVREILILNGGIFADNTFGTPGASGCVLKLPGLIPLAANGVINTALGVPAAAGRSEAVLNINAEIVNAFFPYE